MVMLKRLGTALAAWSVLTSAASAQALRVGAAGAVITPHVSADAPPVWLAGFGIGRRATGVHDDLLACAMVIEAGGRRVALVSLDLIGFMYDEVKRTRNELAARLPDAKFDAVIVACTHNHEGPDTLGLWGGAVDRTGLNADYMKFVREKTVEAIAAALKGVEPALMLAAEGEVKGLMKDSRKPFVLDEKAFVIRFDSLRTGKSIATFLNWSNHPEALGSKNTLVSSDFPHYVREAVQAKWGGTVIYTVGSVGGLMTPLGVRLADPRTGAPLPADSFEATREFGRRAADAMIGLLHNARPEQPETISVRTKRFFVPLTNLRFRVAGGAGIVQRTVYTDGRVDDRRGTASLEGVLLPPSAGRPLQRLESASVSPLILGNDVETEVMVLDIGSAQIATVPGELYPEAANGGIQSPQDPGADFQGAPSERPIRDMMAGRLKIILGLGNDELGYIIPKSQWDEKPPFTYGRETAPYGEVNSASSELAPRVAAALEELLSAAP